MPNFPPKQYLLGYKHVVFGIIVDGSNHCGQFHDGGLYLFGYYKQRLLTKS